MDLFEFAQNQKKEEETPSSGAEAILTVSQITGQVKAAILSRFGQKGVWVKGEISNFKGRNQSGHMYFRLKDEGAVLNCVFFRNANRKLEVELNDGLEVLAFGRLDLWERGGNYQLVVEEIRPGGAGELYLRFEQLKKKLESEGLFDPARKRPLPTHPQRIGLVTSPTGAVIRDMIHVIRRRCPFIQLVLAPVKVQGEGAAEDIARAVADLNSPERSLDLIIVARGGGSIEDLWAFNEEVVARAIAASRLPVVSAVGHQTDFTISDFVADVRAATPSHAAEIVAPDVREILNRADLLIRNIVRELARARDVAVQKLEGLLRSPYLRDPRILLRDRAQRLDDAIDRSTEAIRQKASKDVERVDRGRSILQLLLGRFLEPRRLHFTRIASNLSLLNPLAILERGYSVVTRKDRAIVKSTKQVKAGDQVSVRLHEGTLACEVIKSLPASSKS